MKKLIFLCYLICICVACSTEKKKHDYTKYVNVFIGTADNGHTFPGACVPFGMIQASPETGNNSWKYCSGFNAADDSIIGFAQNHLSGTGCQDLGDILLLPYSGELRRDVYKNKFDKSSQHAYPGYYSVNFPDYNIDVDVTATEHTSFFQFKYNDGTNPHLLVDLQSGIVWHDDALRKHVLEAEMEMPDAYTIIGHQNVRNWVQRQYFYVIKFDKPYFVEEVLPQNEGEVSKRYILGFNLKKGEIVKVKVSMSSVSKKGAEDAMNQENPGWNFDDVRMAAVEKWNHLLEKVEIEGTAEQKANVYTSLYHLYIHPNNIADRDGTYRGADDSIHVSTDGTHYSTFSLWDTFRAAHPLYTILMPEMVDGFVLSMLDYFDIKGHLPIWVLWGKDNYGMIGNHAVPVIVEAYLKGFTGFDAERAYKAVKTSLTVSHRKSDWEIYDKYGYYPYDLVEVESASRTIESGYDDYCAAQMAKKLGYEEDYAFFMKRSNYYKNLFDPSTKLLRAKDSNGHWREPFDVFRLSHAATAGGDYTEGNAWQYSWHVLQDPYSLIDLMGGKEQFVSKLDSLFTIEESSTNNSGFVSDVTGLIGQYAHGNEPSHHVAYLYNYAGRPEKTQKLIREIFDKFYKPKPDGLCGNDDCGQMSAWYLFSAMGFYPVNPVSQTYVLGAPQIPKITLHLPNNKTFIVKANGLSEENKYVKSAYLNGKKIDGFTISHSDVMNGGELVFEMVSSLVDY